RKGKSGVIDFNNRVRIPFRYDDFRYWNDTTALARDGEVWKIVDLKKGVIQGEPFREFEIVNESNDEIIMIARRGTDYGVLSSTRGVVIPIEYTDRKSTRLNSSHVKISYAVFCLKKKKKKR